MIKDIGKWLVIGLALASFISVSLPILFLKNTSEVVSWKWSLLSLYLFLYMYVLLQAFLLQVRLFLRDFHPEPHCILMAGSATNIAALTVIKKTIGTTFMWLYLLSIILGALFFGFLINSIFPQDFFNQYISTSIVHHNYTDIIYITSGIILLSLIFYALFLDHYL